MKKFVTDEFKRFMSSLSGSFCWFRSDFAGKFAELENSGYLQENGPAEMIWQTRSKYVLKVPLGDGKFAVYKTYRKISKPYKYMLRLSPCGAEALNYQLMQDRALPMAKLLAVAEKRRFFRLHNAFIVTEFADGFRDGRDFMPGGCMADRIDLCNEFILRNLALLAHCHDCGILHRGFTPANLLYKLRENADENGNYLDLVWIDVASCRRQSLWRIDRNVEIDLVQFFRFFAFDNARLSDYLASYCRSREKFPLPAAELLKKVQKKLPKAAETEKN